MKSYTCLVLLFGICSCVADSSISESWLENLRNDDIDAYAERPCHHNEMNCIRRYFEQHSRCKVAHGPVPEPFLIKRTTLPLPRANLTLVLFNAVVNGLNGKVTEFTINKKSNKLVVAAEMKNITFRIPKSAFIYHRREKEPVVRYDKSTITYALITFTAVFPNMNKLDITQAEVFSYIDDSNPVYNIGTNVIKTSDMEAIRSFNALVSNIPEVIKEAFIYQGPVFMLNFIQYNICDFGYKIVSN